MQNTNDYQLPPIEEDSAELSSEGHVNSLGGEMKTWVIEGAFVGGIVGFLAALGAYFALVAHAFTIPGIENLQVNHPVIMMFLTVLGFCVGAGAGAVIGVGTPKFNPEPEQGWVKRWETIFLFRNGKETKFYFPILKTR